VRGALRAEWTKLRTLPSTGWLLLGAIVVTIGASAIVAAVWHVNAGSRPDPTKVSLAGVQAGQAIIAVLAILTTAEEYGTGMIRVTLIAIPRRLTLLAAKSVNIGGLTLVTSLIAIAGCLFAGRLQLPHAGIDPAHGYLLPSLGHASSTRAAAGSAIYLTLIALVSLGVATILRDTAASAGAILTMLYLPPVAAQLLQNPNWQRHIDQIAPTTAGLAIQATTHLHSQPISPWAGLGVLAAWAATSLVIAGILLKRRDA
jgi:ABC-2 type transport system permease protein